MTENIGNLIVFLTNNFHFLGYWLAFFAALLETVFIVGLFLPGSSAILILGAFSAQGYLNIGYLFVFAVVGAVIGDNINYYLGEKYGSKWIKEGVWFLKRKHFIAAEIFFDKHGAKSVFFGRFIPSVKEIIPLIAGVLQMKRKTFLIWNILGAIGWGLEWLLAGYIFGQSLEVANHLITKIGIIAMALLAIFIATSVLATYFLKKK